MLQCQLHSALRFVAPNDALLVCVVCWWVQTPASMEPGANLVIRVNTLSKLITWLTRRNVSFAASIALTRSKRVFLVLVRPLMCKGKRTPWSHTCVSVSFMKCKTCTCLIRSPAPLKLNILGLGRWFRPGHQPTITAPSEHANNQSSSIVQLLLWMKKVEFHSLLLEFQAEANFPESFVSWQSFRRLIKFCNAKAAKALPTR